LQYEITGLTALHQPADGRPEVEVNDDINGGEALIGLYVGDVRDPYRFIPP
jgi:hypothetical protein